MNDTEDLMRRLRGEFLDEARHLLDECEESFLRLEDPAARGDELASIFRAMHTVKGSGGVVGLTELVAFAHVVEDCMTILREAPERLDSGITTLLLESCDALRARVDALSQGRDAELWDTHKLVKRLKAVTSTLRGVEDQSLAAAAAAAAAATQAGFGIFDDEPAAPKATPQAAAASAAASKAKHAEKMTGSVKIDAARIEAVLDLVGEIVVIKSQLVNKSQTYGDDPSFTAVVALLDKTVRELQDRTLSMRMTPLKPMFVKLERLARDLSLKVGKQVDVTVAGEDTEIDRTMVEVVADPLLHLVRNALDHGLEPEDDRLASGKAARGHLTIAASQRGSIIELRVGDDGRGIDRARVVARAIERGLLPAGTQVDQLPEAEVYGLLMLPGFSTAAQVSDLSGRGVGLDVVKTHVERLRGTISVESTLGKGTTWIMSIPLTASIRDGMIVQVDGFPYVLPVDRIRELVKVKAEDVCSLSGTSRVVRVRDRVLPWVDLSDFVHGRRTERPDGGLFVVIEQAGQWIALRVDELVGQVQVVMKPLEVGLGATTGVTGAAVLGDGRVALILDTEGLSRWAKTPQLVG